MTVPIIPGPWDWVKQLGEAGRKVLDAKTHGEELGRQRHEQDQQRAMLQSQFMMQMLNSGMGDPSAMLPQLQSSMAQAGVGGITPESVGSYGETIQQEQTARKGKAKLGAAQTEADLENLPADQQAARFKSMFPEIESDATNAASEAINKLKRPPAAGDLESLTEQAVKAFEMRRTKIGGKPISDQDREYVRPFIASAVHDQYAKWFHLQSERTSAENRYGAGNNAVTMRTLTAQFNASMDALAKMRGSPAALAWLRGVEGSEALSPKTAEMFGPQIAEYRRHQAIVAIVQMAMNQTISPEDAQARISALGPQPGGLSTGGAPTGKRPIRKDIVDKVKAAPPAERTKAILDQKVKQGVITQEEADEISKEPKKSLGDTIQQGAAKVGSAINNAGRAVFTGGVKK